jgi:hypothetical protein|tara:strand:- start:1308 stop:1496 length:189 start_codon:yes stop_codon:yes gene_type:complete
MAKNLWDKEQKTLFKKYYREYKSEGFDESEAKRLAKHDTDTVMSEHIDLAESLYESKLNDNN